MHQPACGLLVSVPGFLRPVYRAGKEQVIYLFPPFFSWSAMVEPGQYSIRELIFNSSQNPDRHAIECPGHRPLTYRGLRVKVRTIVRALNNRGFCTSDRIAVITPAGPETAVLILSVMAGFTCVPLNPQKRETEFKRYFRQLNIKAVILQKGYSSEAGAAARALDIPVIEQVPVPGYAGAFGLEPNISPGGNEAEFASPSDIALLLFTSGTTGTEKIVPILQNKFVLNQHRQITALAMTAAERFLHILPYYHAAGLSVPLTGTLLAGGTVICTEQFIPSDFLRLLKTCRPTYYSAVPAFHKAILRDIRKAPPEELRNTSLRGIRSSSASLDAGVYRELGRLLHVPVINVYSMSETGVISINLPPREGSVGLPVIESLTIRDEYGNILKDGENGEIVVRGETVFTGYEDAFNKDNAEFIDGAFRTGDMGYVDDDGYLFITGRKKELINKGGEKISPEEIDTILKTHPAIADAMAFSVSDPDLGEDIAAMVIRKKGSLSEDRLRMFILDHLSPSKVPRRIYFVDEIPKTPSGKPMRYEGTRRYSLVS